MMCIWPRERRKRLLFLRPGGKEEEKGDLWRGASLFGRCNLRPASILGNRKNKRLFFVNIMVSIYTRCIQKCRHNFYRRFRGTVSNVSPSFIAAARTLRILLNNGCGA